MVANKDSDSLALGEVVCIQWNGAYPITLLTASPLFQLSRVSPGNAVSQTTQISKLSQFSENAERLCYQARIKCLPHIQQSCRSVPAFKDKSRSRLVKVESMCDPLTDVPFQLRHGFTKPYQPLLGTTDRTASCRFQVSKVHHFALEDY